MANNYKVTNLGVNTAANAYAALFNSGKLRLYDGLQPATADTSIGAQNLLAELTFGNPAFGSSALGVLTAEAITADSDADATGAATWFRAFQSNGTTAICDGSVGTATSDLILNSTAIQIHAIVSVTALTITLPKG